MQDKSATAPTISLRPVGMRSWHDTNRSSYGRVNDRSIPPQLACYIPIFFSIVCIIIVVGINTPESLTIVVPVMIIFGIVLVLGKYAELA
jgi:uncharacterized membrane protein YhaH (DUF805 family)